MCMAEWTATDVAHCLAPLRRYARVLTREPGAADELVQETLLRAYERAATFQAGAALKPWLLAILHNLHVGSRRRAAVEVRVIETVAQHSLLNTGDPLPSEHALLLQEVAARFDALPETQRAVLHLIVVEGLSYRQAADALAVPIGTVMSRLSRARAALREPQESAGRPALHLIGGARAS